MVTTTSIRLIFGGLLSIATTVNGMDKLFFEGLKLSLSERPLTFYETQPQKYNDQLCVTQFLEVLNGIGHTKRWAIESGYIVFN